MSGSGCMTWRLRDAAGNRLATGSPSGEDQCSACPRIPGQNQLAVVRYVDDLLLVSTWCLECLEPVVKRVYPPTITFDIEKKSYTKVQWLDVCLVAADSRVVQARAIPRPAAVATISA